MKDFSKLSPAELADPRGYDCPCGRHHRTGIEFLCIEAGAVRQLPAALARLGVSRPFVVCDPDSKAAAWDAVRKERNRRENEACTYWELISEPPARNACS